MVIGFVIGRSVQCKERLYGMWSRRHLGKERLIDESAAENVGCEYGEYC